MNAARDSVIVKVLHASADITHQPDPMIMGFHSLWKRQQTSQCFSSKTHRAAEVGHRPKEKTTDISDGCLVVPTSYQATIGSAVSS